MHLFFLPRFKCVRINPTLLLHTPLSPTTCLHETNDLGQVLLGRVDADAERALLGRILGGVEAAAQHLPVILLWTETRKSRKALLYDGAHERHAIVEYVRKQLEPPAKKLTTITAVENFVKDPQFGALGTAPSEVVTVRRFSLLEISRRRDRHCS